MNKINLDFYKGNAKSSSWGWVLLLIGALSAVEMVMLHNEISVERERIQSELTQLQNTASQRRSTGSNDQETKQKFEQAEVVVEQLSFPWNKLFEAIENSAGKNVALLSILPDASTRTVELNGEAKDWKSLVNYIKKLEAEHFFLSVQLVNHQIQQADPQRPMRFKLTCAWSSSLPASSVGTSKSISATSQ